MKEHKHYPVCGCGLARMWKFFLSGFRFQRLIDWKTRTSICHECGALIRVPKSINIVGLFLPVICIPSSFLCFTVIFYPLHMPEWLKITIGVTILVFFTLLSNALLNSLAMAFGRWEFVEIGEQGVEDVKQQLRKDVELA